MKSQTEWAEPEPFNEDDFNVLTERFRSSLEGHPLETLGVADRMIADMREQFFDKWA